MLFKRWLWNLILFNSCLPRESSKELHNCFPFSSNSSEASCSGFSSSLSHNDDINISLLIISLFSLITVPQNPYNKVPKTLQKLDYAFKCHTLDLPLFQTASAPKSPVESWTPIFQSFLDRFSNASALYTRFYDDIIYNSIKIINQAFLGCICPLDSFSTPSVAELCLTLCFSNDCSPPGSSVHGILQARILEWVAMPSSRGSAQHRDWTRVSCISCIGRQILYHCATWEVKEAH